MELIDVVNKLTGSIDPVGETNEDDRRFKNLKTTTALVEKLIQGVQWVANHNRVRGEYSMSRAGKYADKFLKDMSEEIAPLMDWPKLIEDLESSGDFSVLGFPKIVKEPSGIKQDSDSEMFEHEYVDQKTGVCGDDFSGTISFPLPDGRYVEIYYQT